MKKLLGLILILACVSLWTPAHAGKVTKVFTGDSTTCQAVYISSSGAQNNYGRVVTSSRVVVAAGPLYSNFQRAMFRFPYVKDTCDAAGIIGFDSICLILVAQSTSITAGDSWSYRLSVIDTNRNWVEGNQNGAAAANCEVCWDSTQKIGTGSCATAQDWAGDGATGAGDTMGVAPCANVPRCSLIVNDTWAAGKICTLWIDPNGSEYWLVSGGNQGVILFTNWKSGNISGLVYFYGDEDNNITSRLDSLPKLVVFGETSGETPTTHRRRVILAAEPDHMESPRWFQDYIGRTQQGDWESLLGHGAVSWWAFVNQTDSYGLSVWGGNK